MASLTIYTDGASRGNPGAAAYAYVIQRDGDHPIEQAGCLGDLTNNQAEYTALVRALEHALRLGPDNSLIVHSDSELMVKQMKGEYKVKNEDLRGLYLQARGTVEKFTGRILFKHVRREYNRRADELCNLALDGQLPTSLAESSDTASAPARVIPEIPEVPKALPASLPGGNGESLSPSGLRDEVIAVLRLAGARPTPEAVWDQIRAVIEQHAQRMLRG